MLSKKSDIGTDPHTGSDFSWHNAQTFWIIIIIAFSILILHILYKLTKSIRQRRRARIAEIQQLTVQRSHLFEEDVVVAETARRVRGLQVPSRALTRRSSDVSALPRYEKFSEDPRCDEYVEVEKRGKYTYVVQPWGGRRENTVNQSSQWEGGYDADAVAVGNDMLVPIYHRL
jgi:hypothetical protein